MKPTVSVNFPDHNINPNDKDSEFIRTFIQAAWSEQEQEKYSFYHQGYKFHKITKYARGEQSTDEYLEEVGLDSDSDLAHAAINTTVLPIANKFERMALGMTGKQGFDIQATPVDQMAKSARDDYFAEQKARITLREAIAKTGNTEVAAGHPVLKGNTGDPQDLEELEMQGLYTSKHNTSIEAEIGIQAVLNENKYSQTLSKRVKKSLWRYGVAIVKDRIDEQSKIRTKYLDPWKFICSFCEEPDFSDAAYMGDVDDITLGELKNRTGDRFDAEDWLVIAGKLLGKNGNPRSMPQGANYPENTLKVRIINLEFESVNNFTYQRRKTKFGNTVTARSKWTMTPNSKKGELNKSATVMYKGSWIEGTNFIFDEDKVQDQKRDRANYYHGAKYSYNAIAPELYDMVPLGIMRQIIPLIDNIHTSWYKLQNVINEARPKGIAIDITGIEGISLGEEGEVLDPEDILDMFVEKGVLIFRRYDPKSGYSTSKPIEELNNGVGTDAVFFFNQIVNDIELIRSITGLNELTDGSTPSSKTLVGVAKMAQEGTSNALDFILTGESQLLELMAESVMIRLQDLIKSGEGYESYVDALGDGSIEFWKTNKLDSLIKMGITVIPKPTQEQRIRLLEFATKYSGEEGLTPEDVFLIENTNNIKQAQQILSIRYSRRKKEAREHSLKVVKEQAAGQGDADVKRMQAETEKIKAEYEEKKALETHKGEIQAEYEKLRHKNRMEEVGENAINDGAKLGVEKGMEVARDNRGGV